MLHLSEITMVATLCNHTEPHLFVFELQLSTAGNVITGITATNFRFTMSQREELRLGALMVEEEVEEAGLKKTEMTGRRASPVGPMRRRWSWSGR